MTRIAVGLLIVDAGRRDAHTPPPASTGRPAAVAPPRPQLRTIVGGFPAAGVRGEMPVLAAVAMRAPRAAPTAPA